MCRDRFKPALIPLGGDNGVPNLRAYELAYRSRFDQLHSVGVEKAQTLHTCETLFVTGGSDDVSARAFADRFSYLAVLSRCVCRTVFCCFVMNSNRCTRVRRQRRKFTATIYKADL